LHLERLDAAESDHADPDDDSPIAHLGLGEMDGVQSTPERFQGGRFVVAQFIRNQTDTARLVHVRNANVLGVGAGESVSDALFPAAPFATAWITDGDPIAGSQMADVTADLDDLAGPFMPHDFAGLDP
jgi:hypothetical protein